MYRPVAASAALLVTLSCYRAGAPYQLEFAVNPTQGGARVEVTVEGGPRDTAYVGFGVGPGTPEAITSRIANVEAWSAQGDRLAVLSEGAGAFSVEVPSGPHWIFAYDLVLRPFENAPRGAWAPSLSAGPTFYRSSSRGADHLVLVGPDAWARFYDDPRAVYRSPGNRQPGRVSGATIRFGSPELPDGWRVATGLAPASPGRYVLAMHPIDTVFALGPYEMQPLGPDSDMRIARHRDWDVLPLATGALVSSLLGALRADVGRPPRDAIMLLTPLPAAYGGEQPGLRTAGMVRNDTLILYASVNERGPIDRIKLREAMAVFIGHELFHLWVPASLPLTLELSWLSEGWATHMGRRAAVASEWLTPGGSVEHLRRSYQRYVEFGGYRAGSLPSASVGDESQRSLLYLRGELVFQLLAREWRAAGHTGSFDEALWRALVSRAEPNRPLDSSAVRDVLARLVSEDTVRRYVEGDAPLTPAVLGFDLR